MMYKEVHKKVEDYSDIQVVKQLNKTQAKAPLFNATVDMKTYPVLSMPKKPPPVTVVTSDNIKKRDKTVDIDLCRKKLTKLMQVPSDLEEVMPHASQVWNCDEIGGARRRR